MKKSLVMLVAMLGLPALLSGAFWDKKPKVATESKKKVAEKPVLKCDKKTGEKFSRGENFGECMTSCRQQHRDIGCHRGQLRDQCWDICDPEHPGRGYGRQQKDGKPARQGRGMGWGGWR